MGDLQANATTAFSLVHQSDCSSLISCGKDLVAVVWLSYYRGLKKPSGSNSELTIAKIPRLVIAPFCTRCWSLPDALQINLSSSTSHFNPRAHSVGNSCMSKFATETAFSVSGISASTLLSLLNHLFNLNLPFASNYLSCVESLTAVVGVSTDFIRSSTYVFLSTVRTTSRSNSVS